MATKRISSGTRPVYASEVRQTTSTPGTTNARVVVVKKITTTATPSHTETPKTEAEWRAEVERLSKELTASIQRETESGERIKQLLAQLSQSSQTLEDSEQRDARFRALNEEVTKLRADKARLEADLKAANQELERWRKGTLSVTLESTAKPVKVAAVSKPSEPESVLQKQLTDARANVKKLTLQVQELTEANATLSKKLADAAGREKVVQITTLATATSTPIADAAQSAAIKELQVQVDDLQGRLDTALEERGEFEQQVIALNESTARYKTELARIQADSTSKHRATADVERVKSELTKRITELEITLQRERAARGVTAATNDKVLEEARAKVLELTSQCKTLEARLDTAQKEMKTAKEELNKFVKLKTEAPASFFVTTTKLLCSIDWD